MCQRRREDVSADRSKNASRTGGQLERSFPVRLMSLLSRPDLGTDRRGAQRRGWEARSHAQQREHGEHRTFPVVSTVAGWPGSGLYVRRWRCLLCLRR